MGDLLLGCVVGGTSNWDDDDGVDKNVWFW